MISEFSKVVRYKQHNKISSICIHHNDLAEKELKSITIHNSYKTIKCLGINLTKDVKDLKDAKYKVQI